MLFFIIVYDACVILAQLLPVNPSESKVTLHRLIGISYSDDIAVCCKDRKVKAIPNEGKSHVCPHVQHPESAQHSSDCEPAAWVE